MLKAVSIIKGWANYLWPTEYMEKIARNRAVVCGECPEAVESKWMEPMGDDIQEIEGLKCKQCDCPLSTKLRSEGEKCPLTKW